MRANASYTLPKVDVLLGVVFQYRPGAARSANLTISNADVAWEATSASRDGTLFFNAGTTPASTATVNLLDSGDLYGEGLRLTDLKFSKNVRFGNKRLNLGVDIFNVFNSDAATGYNNTYTAFRLADGTYVADNPATTGYRRSADLGYGHGCTTTAARQAVDLVRLLTARGRGSLGRSHHPRNRKT